MHNKLALLAWIEDQIDFFTSAEEEGMLADCHKLHKQVSGMKLEDFDLGEDYSTVYTLMQAVQRFDNDAAALRLVAVLALGIEWESPFVTVNFLEGDDMEPVCEQMDDESDDSREEEMRALRAVIFAAADAWMFRYSGLMEV